MKYWIGLIGLQCCFGVVFGAVPELPELEWSERSDWLNVTKDVMPAAMGDGTTDDTRALQVALDTVAQAKGADARTMYLPPGTYRISETLHLANCDGVTMIGHGRTTRIVWAGKADVERGMFWSDGVPRSRYIGMVWDGVGSAVVGHDHGSTNRFETRLRYVHWRREGACDSASICVSR